MAEIEPGCQRVAASERDVVLNGGVEREVRRVGLLFPPQIDAAGTGRSGRLVAGRQRGGARIGREKGAEPAVHQRDAEIEREMAEMESGLRLRAVDLRRVGYVELDAKHRKGRIADDDLEVAVIVV